MRITLNGRTHETEAATLAALLEEAGVDDRAVATAVNGDFAPRGRRGEIRLAEGDAVEILTPRQGG
jgi:sulfur carrier protein